MRHSVRHGGELWLSKHDQHTAAISVWMTDRVARAALPTDPALVSVEALSELALLVNATRSAHDRVTDLHREDQDATSTADAIVHRFDRPQARARLHEQ